MKKFYKKKKEIEGNVIGNEENKRIHRYSHENLGI